MAMLTEWIQASGMTRREVAFALGIGPAMLSLLESGKRKPSLSLAVRIEKLTGIRPAEWEAAA